MGSSLKRSRSSGTRIRLSAPGDDTSKDRVSARALPSAVVSSASRQRVNESSSSDWGEPHRSSGLSRAISMRRPACTARKENSRSPARSSASSSRLDRVRPTSPQSWRPVSTRAPVSSGAATSAQASFSSPVLARKSSSSGSKLKSLSPITSSSSPSSVKSTYSSSSSSIPSAPSCPSFGAFALSDSPPALSDMLPLSEDFLAPASLAAAAALASLAAARRDLLLEKLLRGTEDSCDALMLARADAAAVGREQPGPDANDDDTATTPERCTEDGDRARLTVRSTFTPKKHRCENALGAQLNDGRGLADHASAEPL
mmetsp:Transcript_358/g.1033  ORF Transcript_358/g.1033 Transcript_358/m.1033 type:complete len:315 (+) Transcript_358:688-1632(+)